MSDMPSQNTAMATAKNVSFTANGQRLLNDISVRITSGNITVVLGHMGRAKHCFCQRSWADYAAAWHHHWAITPKTKWCFKNLYYYAGQPVTILNFYVRALMTAQYKTV